VDDAAILNEAGIPRCASGPETLRWRTPMKEYVTLDEIDARRRCWNAWLAAGAARSTRGRTNEHTHTKCSSGQSRAERG